MCITDAPLTTVKETKQEKKQNNNNNNSNTQRGQGDGLGIFTIPPLSMGNAHLIRVIQLGKAVNVASAGKCMCVIYEK